MACFSLPFLEALCIWLIVLIAGISIIRLFIPWLLGLISLAPPSPVAQIINIILWVIIAVLAVKIIFMLLACLLGAPHMLW